MIAARPIDRSVLVDTSRSARCRLRPVPIGSVRLDDPFWAPRLRTNREVTLPAQYRQCEETGRIDNFRRAAGKKEIEFQGIFFNDSDVYKWVEAAAFAIASGPSPELDTMLATVAAEIAAAQEPDGYLNTYFTFERKAERYSNLRDMHELYCDGHLLQAAVAHHRVTGDRSLLDVAVRLADHLCATFGPDGRSGACGHEEIELAMVELFRETGDERYLRQADFFLGQRGRKPPVLGGSPYHQDHRPFRDLDENVGHAVRMLYLDCGAADLYAETGEPALGEALERLWRNFHDRKQYVTGGAGARYEGEAFGADYELPNERAYAETCAAIAGAMWNWRMLTLDGEARFADDLETVLYNGVLSGVALTGTEYFYQNPLADRGRHRRQPWFGCACCPPNIARTLAAVPGCVYSRSDEGIWVHLYARSRAEIELPSGDRVTIVQETEYPWDGEVRLRLESAADRAFTLFLRVPGWCQGASIEINDAGAESAMPGRYAALDRAWRPGDRVTLRLPMPVRLVRSHPHVTGNLGRVAIRRGPLIYCLEAHDHPGVDVWDLSVPLDAAWEIEHRPDLLGGVTVLKTQGVARPAGEALYRDAEGGGAPWSWAPLTAVPYHAWANRDPGPMQVWIPADSG